ncbi:MAG: DUF1611 domain-containing protein [Pseudomonadota bacterium]
MTLMTDPRVQNAKWAFTTRRVARADAAMLIPVDEDAARPLRPGDLVSASVVDIGQHGGLQLTSGRRAVLYPGDEIVACLGARYAPDQFECIAELDGDYAHLVAAGGVCGVVTRQHGRMKTPTLLQVRGRLAGASGAPLNVADYALPQASASGERPTVISVFGATMNAGKTTSAASLIHGLAKAGLKVGACKATGTGACGDFNAYLDAGADAVLDFTDLGYATTFGVEHDQIRSVAQSLVAHLSARSVDVIVMEVADGVLQKETAALMRDPSFRTLTDGALFAAGDALSAINGLATLRNAGHRVLGVTGVVTRSPMACEEAAQEAGVTFLTKNVLASAQGAKSLLAEAAGAVIGLSSSRVAA